MLAEDHENQIDDPDDVPPEDQAQDARQNFSFGEPRNRTANPGRYGNDRQNDAHQIAQAEIIALSCHTFASFFNDSIIYHREGKVNL